MARLFRNLVRNLAACFVVALTATTAVQAASLVPLATFGGGDGWRAPFEVLPGDAAGTDSISAGLYNYLGNAATNTTVNGGNLERGLAYNPTTGHLILVSRNDQAGALPSIRILDGSSGVDLGALNQGSGIVTGGLFNKDMIGVGDDGAIYMANLSIDTSSSPYKVYRWANESATPTVAFSGAPGGLISGARLGDSFDVIGSGASTRLIAGYYRTPAPTGSNGVALFSTTDGATYSATSITMAAAAGQSIPAAGEFSLGLTFSDGDTFMGKSAVNAVQVADVVGSTGTVSANFSTDGQSLHPMDFAVVQGKPLLAVVEASNAQDESAQARIFVYDMTDPTLTLAQRKIGEATALSPFTPGGPNQFINLNGTGQVKFGAINGNVATIYAMSTNNGIEAFTLTLDMPPAPDANFNDDAAVDGADLDIWKTGFGGAGTATTGDANNDGVVDGADFLAWQQQFGPVAAVAAGNVVPEPAAGLMALSALACLAARRRGR